ncbi:MAG: terpene cyclase/mutase family protein [Mariniblastus sp.]|nr:terpene cyclase/mutase family protein [Mariniblastus sp.]
MSHSKFRYGGWFACLLVIVSAAIPLQAQEQNRNSTKKIRVQPGELASRIGSAIDWRTDVEQALKEARETGKPVFWYVPTLKGSFMDRKVEIDRYMLAGPFSHPAIIRLLNTELIPVRAKAKGQNQQKYNLLPFEFVEPGFVLLNPDGSLKQSVDRLTTFQSRWLFQLIAGAAGQPESQFEVTPRLAKQWESAGRGNWSFDVPQLPADDPDAVEAGLLRGMQAFRNNQPGKATRIFAETSQLQSDHPLAWKAAAEAEGIGPFVRGFEVVRDLPGRAYQAGRDSAGSAAPAGVYDEQQLWRSGIDFLLGMQNEAGGYVDSDYDFGGTDSLPNVHVAVTALVGMALLETKQALPDYRREAVDRALLGCARFVSDPAHVNRADRDEILFAYAYSARLLARLKRAGDAAPAMESFPIEKLLQTCVNNLQNLQSKRGGWYHEYENPFVTATALCALHEAQEAGAQVDEAKIRSGVESLASDRGNLGSYPYSSGRRRAARKETERDISAAAGRMPLCEVALRLWDGSDNARLQNAIEQSFRFQENLDVALKYDDHTSRLAYGGFFFWYDMRGRSEAISYVQDDELRRQMEQRQREIVMALPEIDGCFVDSHEIGRCYGTAMALLCLARRSAGN